MPTVAQLDELMALIIRQQLEKTLRNRRRREAAKKARDHHLAQPQLPAPTAAALETTLRIRRNKLEVS